MNNRANIFTAFAIAAAMCCACNGSGPIYSNSEYSWEGDSIIQDSLLAVAESATKVVSNYPEAEFEDGVWELSHDISGFPQYSAPTRLEEALFNLALEEAVIAVEPDSTLRTGKLWGGVWTRDISYSILLGLSHAQSACSMKSLLRKVDSMGRIIEDTGTGGSWPCSTDRNVWVLAAWELYKVTGDGAWLDTIYPVIKRSLETDLATVVDSGTGMLRGESTYLDWRKQEYPLWMKPADIHRSECLGTECVHFQAFTILAEMERMLGTAEDAARYEAVAAGIRDGIDKYLWQEDRGFYAQYIYGKKYMSVSPRFETLGEALAILFGIADEDKAASIVSNGPCEAFGTPCIYPQIADMFPYHNDGVWPFVQCFWNMAAARTGNPDVVLHGMATNYRAAALFLTNKENMVVYNGKWQGTAINSSRQLWSVAAGIGAVYRVIYGMDFEKDGLRLSPMVPKSMAGSRMLKGFNYRDAVLDIALEGYGSGIRSFTLDGKECDAFIPDTLNGEHSVVIRLDGKFPCSGINLVENAYALATPETALDNGVLSWNAVEGATTYKLIRNGKVVSDTAELSCKLESEGEYQVIATAEGRYESFASEPVDFDLVVLTEEMEKFGKSGKKPYTGFSGKAYLPISTTVNTKVDIPVDIESDGRYFIDFKYCNANGAFEEENKCANRTFLCDGRRVDLVVFPQCGDKTYGLWQWSSPVKVRLSKGRHTFTLSYGPENVNMNILVNDAALDLIRISRGE